MNTADHDSPNLPMFAANKGEVPPPPSPKEGLLLIPIEKGGGGPQKFFQPNFSCL